MNKYFKKFSIMFVMLAAVIGIGAIQNSAVANAIERKYIPQKDYSNNLVAEYKFNETSGTICEDSTKENNGIYHGSTGITDNGNTYRHFNGTSDMIKFNSKIIPVGQKSVEFKIKPNPNVSNTSLIITNASGDQYGFDVWLTNNKTLNFYIHNADNWVKENSVINCSSSTNINDGKWHTVLFTWDGTTNLHGAKIYIDDLTNPEVSTTAYRKETSDPSNNLSIGRQCIYDANYYAGDLDDVKIYNDVIEYKSVSSEISLDNSTLTLPVDTSKQLAVTTTPAGAQVEWSSNNTGTVTVEQDGTIKGIAEGTATITAKIKGTDIKATCVVTVTNGDTPNPPQPTGDGNLFIELVDGQIKSYQVTASQIEDFKQWYLDRDDTKSNKPYYHFTKGSYNDYVIHDKIDWFEVR